MSDHSTAKDSSELANKLVYSPRTVRIELRKDLTRAIKRGHAWLYSDAIEIVRAESGSTAILSGRKGPAGKGLVIASGIYDPQHAIPLRVCRTSPPWELDSRWLAAQLQRAHALRQSILPGETTGFRWIAGEGDGLPGLIIDVYERVAVIKLDGGGPESFYRPQAIANWLIEHYGFEQVVLRSRQRGQPGQVIAGSRLTQPVIFVENGLRFTADVISGQKTGFFLDQRDNRHVIRQASRGRRVLNLFSFNGGFSVAAGRGGAADVTSVDIAAPAIVAAEEHWRLNGLDQPHHGVVDDCFAFLDRGATLGERWDLVICDPPSFAPSERTRDRGLAAYSRLAQLAASVTARDGLLALASCSSHVDAAAFAQANMEGIGRARRHATLLLERGLPLDHPTPMAMPELRYLKFQLLRMA
jgi:23S rRNA (cytosine1962-C5)-methyltransferase